MDYKAAEKYYYEANSYFMSNPTKSTEMFIESANAGYVEAMVRVGMAYRDGHGVTKNPAEALKWFTLAADQGDTSGIACLDDVYQDLYGADWEDYYVPVMEKYAAKGFQEARDTLARKREYGLIGKKRNSSQQVANSSNATKKDIQPQASARVRRNRMKFALSLVIIFIICVIIALQK